MKKKNTITKKKTFNTNNTVLTVTLFCDNANNRVFKHRSSRFLGNRIPDLWGKYSKSTNLPE